jgi:hypothetical protein
MNKVLNLIDRKVVLLLFITLSIVLLDSTEPGGESWGYWFFSKELLNGNGFIISSRSPLYTIYLNLFSWSGYPYFFTIESFFSASIVAYSLYSLFKIKLNIWHALLAAVIWIPFIMQSVPPVQPLALALSCFAFILRKKIRDDNEQRRLYSISYSLLILAFMMRPTYILIIFVVVTYDLWKLYKSDDLKKMLLGLKLQKTDWILLATLITMIFLSTSPSQHQWNNAWLSSTIWFPGDEHISLRDSGFIQGLNWKYIQNTFKTFEKHDFYFTNQEVFNGAKTMWEALDNNFTFVITQCGENVKDLIAMFSWMNIFSLFIKESIPWVGEIFGIAFILVGAFQACKKDNELCIFLIGTILLIGVSALAISRIRYMVPAVPFLVLSAHWYTLKIKEKLVAILFPAKFNPRLFFIIFFFSVGLFVLFLSFGKSFVNHNIFLPILLKLEKNSSCFWPMIIGFLIFILIGISFNFLSYWDTTKHDFQLKKVLLERLVFPFILLSFIPIVWSWGPIFNGAINNIKEDRFSLIQSHKNLREIAKDCRGIMTLEHLIFPLIFDSVASNLNIYDIWEVPPFGSLDNSKYSGLNVSRINCMFISKNLEETIGFATNARIRYTNYIEPYAEKLESMGAITYNIKNYGRAVVLP